MKKSLITSGLVGGPQLWMIPLYDDDDDNDDDDEDGIDKGHVTYKLSIHGY